jgi:uncharacterized protein
MVTSPAAAGLVYEDVYFKTEDDVRINAWWVPAARPRGTVLFCHGNAGNISFLTDTISVFTSMGLNVMVFDYRGYGKSGGVPSEEGTYRDVRAAWRYMTDIKKIDHGKIIVIGRSLGGPIAAWLCQSVRPCALVLESTFTNAADVANFHYSAAQGSIIFGDTYNTASYVPRVECPVLVIHSPEDEIAPFVLGEKLFRLAPKPREFLLIHGSHDEGFMQSLEHYRSGLDRFLSRYLK